MKPDSILGDFLKTEKPKTAKVDFTPEGWPRLTFGKVSWTVHGPLAVRNEKVIESYHKRE